jgi:hypothetical protein
MTAWTLSVLTGIWVVTLLAGMLITTFTQGTGRVQAYPLFGLAAQSVAGAVAIGCVYALLYSGIVGMLERSGPFVDADHVGAYSFVALLILGIAINVVPAQICEYFMDGFGWDSAWVRVYLAITYVLGVLAYPVLNIALAMGRDPSRYP